MKKSLKNRFKKWNIGDYVRQFSIVTGGVLLTLWLTAKIADSAKQREVRQASSLRSNCATTCKLYRITNGCTTTRNGSHTA